MQKLIHLALTLAFVLPLSATVLPAPTVTSSSPGFQGIYVGSNAVGQGLSEFLSEQGTNTFLEFDFGSARTVDGFVNVTLNLAQRSIGANRLIFDTDGTAGFNAATDTVISFTQAQTGSQGQGFIQRFRAVTAQRVRWEVLAVVGSPSLVGTTEISFLSTNAATVPITGVTVIGSATPFSSQYAAANAANGIAGIGMVAGVEYASLGQNANAYVDFDLGSQRAITGFDMFDRLFDAERATSFDLIFSNNADMSSPVATRSYSKASSWTASDNFAAPITARYVRYDVTGGSGNTGISDIQFYASEFPGANLGAISSASPREVTFTVTGKTGVVSDVTLDWTLSPAQGNAHELSVELIAPDNTLCDVFRAHVVDDTDIAGPYVFNDAYSTLLSNVVASTPSGSAAAGNYRPEYSNTARSFRTSFGSKAPNGTWKLRFTDFINNAFTASVSAANLSIRTVPAPPSITTVQPNLSLPAGGAVTLTGTDFSGTPTVTIGGVAATNVVVVNSTTITCTAPLGSVGTKNIVVTNANGSATLTNGYRYTDLIVTSTADTGSGTLREALSDAQTLSGANTITFAAGISGQTITLTTTPIVVGSGFVTDDTGGVILDASSLANGLTLTTNLTNTRIFYARTGSLTLRNLTIANAGGAMPGGGIFSSATITLERCTLNNNSAAGQEGGAIYNYSTATLVQCTLTGNVAGNGAGIHNNGTLTVRHCTIAGNTANAGGGIFMQTGMTLENSIVAGNMANAGLNILNGPTLTRVGANIIPNLHTNSGLAGSGSIIASDPLLGTFSTHGGPTKTFPLLAGSPAINAAVGSSITSDQRGSPIFEGADIGAFESQINRPTVTTPTSSAVSFTIATLGGNVTSNGAAALTERGVVYSLTSANNDPLISGSGVTKTVASGTSTGVFTQNVTGLSAGSAYSFKAYATNSQGTSYSSVGTFNTTVQPPEINVTPSSAQDFGLQRMGVAGSPRTFTIQNQGNGALTISSVITTGDKAAEYVVSTSGMLSTVPGLGSTTFTVVFNPGGTGDRATTLRIVNNDSDEGTINIALTGVGSDTDPPSVTEPVSGVPLATTITLGGTVASQGALSERGVVVSSTLTNPNPFVGGPGVLRFVASGLSSGAFNANATGLTGGTAYTFKAYATNSGGTSYSSTGTFITPSNNADLTTLATSSGILSPAFATGTTAYTMTLLHSTTSMTLTPTRTHPLATIQVRVNTSGFAPVTSGTASAPLELNVGENAILVRVTAQDGSMKDYQILATRQASIIADLSALTVSTGTLTPAFSAAQTTYTVAVPNATTSLTVTPTVAQADATVTVNGSNQPVTLNIGANVINVLVTAQDTSVTRNYAITVTRADFPNTAPSFVIPTASGSVLGATWTQRLNDANRVWRGIALSADGQRIAACANGGSIWTSVDGGVSWTERTSAGTRSWSGICSSADGTRLAATAVGGRIWISGNSGLTWTERTGVPIGDWGAITCDSTGLRLFTSNHSFGGVSYTSTNQGLAWTTRTLPRSLNLASSADGNRLAGFVTGGRLQVSSNGGTSWTSTNFAHPGMRDLAMSANGNLILCAVNEGATGQIFLSTTSGTSFTRVGPNTGINSVTCSSDGTRAACLDKEGLVYTSSDSGVTWVQTAARPIGIASQLRLSGNGTSLAAMTEVLHTSEASSSSTQTAAAGDPQQTVPNFVRNISPGTRASEATQTVSFNVTNTNNALFSVQPSIAANGSLTYTPAASGTGTATVSIIAQDNGGTAEGGVNSSAAQTFTFTLTAAPNLDLASLTISTGTLAPAFVAATTSYTASVADTVTSVTLTPTLADAAMRLSVNGSSLASGTTSTALPLAYGPNTLVVTVSNASGTRTKPYSIVVTRTPILATVTQLGLSNISAITASLTATQTADGGSAVTERGFVFALTSANADPILGGTNVTRFISSSSSFTADLTDLVENSDYTVKAYATNGVGTAYSSVLTFKTLLITRPEITGVQPVASLIAGGGSIGLRGRYFTGATAITIGGVPATNITVLDDTSVTATLPAGTLGGKDIVVTTSIGSGTARNAFRYVDLGVTSTAATGTGSLSEALRAAADCAGPNVITFAPALATQTLRLNPAVVAGTDDDSAFVIDDLGGVTLEGNGLTLSRADFRLSCRVFYLRSGTLTLRGLTIQNAGGDLSGGAIFSSGTLNVERCTLNNNTGVLGGAIYNDNGTLTVTQSTLASNSASSGGAIFNDGALMVRHSTLAGNSATTLGGGIRLNKAMTLENSIVAGNSAAQGFDIHNDQASITRLGASIVPMVSLNFNVSGLGILLASDPLLTGLAANGGTTRTMGLQAGSPAINAAVGSSITSDQRGQAILSTPDIGAFELPASLPLLGLSSATNVGSLSATLNGRLASNGGASISASGFVYALTSANADPQIGGSGVTQVSASFTANVSGLAHGSAYSFRAFVTNNIGTAYSPVASFTTVSRNADLSALSLSSSTLSPAFSAATTNYTASVANSVGNVNVFSSTAQADATIKVDGGYLGVGSNTITVRVTAQDPSVTKTYTITVIRAAGLPTLDRMQFAATTANSTTVRGRIAFTGGAAATARGIVIALSATNNNPTIGGTGVTAFTPSDVFGNFFTASATGLTANSRYALRGYATNSAGTSYSDVEIFSTLSADATLSALTLSLGTLSPAFAAATENYTTTVDATELNLTPTVTEAGASILVNNETVVSGNISRPIRLGPGVNTVTLLVTARDGSATKTYTLAVTRAPRAPLLAPEATRTAVLATTATLGGNITAENGATITERGIVYALTSANNNPIIGGSGVTKVVAGGTAPGVFTAAVTGLAATSNYTFKAYATNSAGTGYSAVSSFATGTGAPNLPPSFTLPPGTVLPAGGSWTQLAQGFSLVDCSDDGTRLLIGDGAKMLTSTNGGTSFTPRPFRNEFGGSMSSVAMSDNANVLYAGGASGSSSYVIGSGNGGTSVGMSYIWNGDRSPEPKLAISDTASRVYLIGGGSKFTNILVNAGTGWAVRATEEDWKAIACSGDGMKAVAGSSYELYTTENGGDTWLKRSGPRSQFWSALAYSKNGNVILGATLNGGLWISSDSGKSWISRLASPGRNWKAVAASADGRVLAAAGVDTKIWISSNAGDSWVEQSSSASTQWNSLAMSADGLTLYAGASAAFGPFGWKSVGTTSPVLELLPGSGTVTMPAFAKSISPGTNEANQTVSFVITTDNNALFRTLPSISRNGTLTFAPGITPGQATVTVSLQDDGGTASGGVDTSATQTFIVRLRNDDSRGTWSTAAWTDDSTSGIVPGRTLWARHFGSTAPATVNNVSVPGITNMTGNNQDFDLDSPQLFPSDTNTLTSAGGGSATLAGSFFWGGNPTKIQLKGLGVGQEYVLTLLTVGWDADTAGQRVLHFGSGSDAVQVDQSQFGSNGGLRVEYSFTADKPTRSITIAQANNNGASLHLYALGLRFAGSTLNTAPSAITLDNNTIAEGNAPNGIVGALTTTDPDITNGQSHTYALVSGLGDGDNARFAIKGSALTLNQSADFETRTTLNLRLSSTDNGYPVKSVEQTFTVRITDVDEPATDITLTPNQLDENLGKYQEILGSMNTFPDLGASVDVGTLSVVGDPDTVGDISLVYDGNDDSGLFYTRNPTGRSVTLQTPGWKNFETKSQYKIRVRAGNGAAAIEKDFTVLIKDKPDAPVINALANQSINEDTASAVIPFTITDEDAGDLTRMVVTATSSNPALVPPAGILLGGSAGARTIQLTPSLNQFGSSIITVTASDGVLASSKSFTLTVAPVDDPMSFDLPATLSVAAIGTQNVSNFVSNLSAGPNEDTLGRTFTWAVSVDKPTTMVSSVSYNFNLLTLLAANSGIKGSTILTLTGREMNGSNVVSTVSRTCTVNISSNRAPTDIVLSNAVTDENVTNLDIGTLTTTDPDTTDTHSYSFVDWTGREATANGLFTVNGSTLRWKDRPNFETASSYHVRIRTTDRSTQGAASFEKSFTITLRDLNEPATDVTFGLGVEENGGQGLLVGKLVAVDPERLQSHSFALVAGAGDTHNSTVTLTNGNELIANGSYNFEVTPALSLRVQVTDNGNPPQTMVKELKVPVRDRNDPPTRPVFTFTGLPEGNHDATRPPNTAPRQIGTLSSTDEDGTPMAYEIIQRFYGPVEGDDSHMFYIEGQTNKVMFRGLADFDSAKKRFSFKANAYNVTKRGDKWFDVGIGRAVATVEVDISPVDEAPVFGEFPSAVQRPGAKLMDIFYAAQDIDSPTATVSLEFSPDNGATWRTCTSVKGDVGVVSGNLFGARKEPRDDLHPLEGTYRELFRLAQLATGFAKVKSGFEYVGGYQVSNDRHIEWDVGKDFDQQFIPNGSFRLTMVSGTNGATRTRDVGTVPGTSSGYVTVDTRFDGPLMISGIVTNKLRNMGWPDVKLQIGTRTAVTDTKGYYFIANAAPGKLTTSHPNFCGYDIDVAAPDRGQGVAMPTLRLTPNTEPPVVNSISLSAGKSPAFLSEVPITSTVGANISWNTNGIFAFPHLFEVDVSANGRQLNKFTHQTSYNFTSSAYSLQSILTPSMIPGNNWIGVQAKNDLGLQSTLEKLSVTYLPLHPLIKLFQPKSTWSSPNGFESYSANHFGFNFGSTDFNYTIENRLIGKWGVVFGTTGSFDYTVNDANWELAYRGGDQARFGNQTKSHKFFTRPKAKIEEQAAKDKAWFNNKFFLALPDDDDQGKIALFLGEDIREAAFFARAIGTLDPTSGWTLPDVEGAVIQRSYGPIGEVGVLDSIPGMQPVAEFVDLTLTLSAGTDLGGSARFAPKKGSAQFKDVLSYRLKDATISGALEVRATLSLDAKLAGAEVWVGGRGFARVGYPAPLLREVDLKIQAGYEWWIGFVDDEGEVTLGHFNYSAKNDPNAPKAPAASTSSSRLAQMFGAPSPANSKDGVNFSLPPLQVVGTRSRGIGPMTRRWRDYGAESFELADVASPSTIQQARNARMNRTSAVAPVNTVIVPELTAFNRMSRPAVKADVPVQKKDGKGDIGIARIISSDPVPTQAVLPLISNVFPRSRPVMAEKDGKIMLLYVRDTGAANAYQFSEVAFTYYDGTSWTIPGPIAVDSRAQMTPQLAFDGNGNAVAVWSRIKDANWNGLGLIEGQNALIEIVSANWNASTGAWSTPVAITDNNILDHRTVLSGKLSDGDLMLTWVSNAGNVISGTTDDPDSLFAARWDAATASWGPGALVHSGITGTAQMDFTANGEKAVVAWVQTMTAGDKSSDELYSQTWTSGTWAAPVRVTDDAVRDTDVRLALTPQGDAYALWLRDGDLVMQSNFTGEPSIVRPKDLPGTPDNFALTMGPENQLMVLWEGVFGDESPDVAYRLYTPSADSWSEDVRLSNDAEQERFLAPILDAQGNLLIAYLNTEMNQVTVEAENDDGSKTIVDGALRPGRTDLLLARRRMITELSVEAESLIATANSWGPGSIVTLKATALNTGDKPVMNAALAFYDGDPATGGTLIGTSTVPGEFKGGTSAEVTLDWTMPSDSEDLHTVFAVMDPQNIIIENDETNNRLSKRVGGPDLYLEYLGSDVMADGSANARVRVTNVGSPISAGTEVQVWDAPTRGANPLTTVSVPALTPLASMEMLIQFPAGTVGSSGRRELEMIANEIMIASEPNQGNNRSVFVLAGTRPLSNVTGLSDLAVTGGTLSPVFAMATLGYQTAVPAEQTTITLVPTALDPFSKIKVNGQDVASGTLSQVLTLNSGSTQIVIDVTSEDGSKTMTYTVDVLRSITNLTDSGTGSLRGMVAAAALNGGPDVIAIPASMSGQTLRLSSALVINDPNGVIIDGSALPQGLIIEGNGNHRLFEVAANSSLTLICVTLKDGGGTSFTSNGGAIQNAGTLRVERCTLLDNQAASGGAIHSTGTATILQSTFAQNTATSQGGAVFNEGTASIVFSTLSANIGGTVRSSGTLNVENSIIALNSGSDIDSTGALRLSYAGSNIVLNVTGITASGNAPITSSPLLSALGDYGGPTLTFVPSVGSPAVDQALATTSPVADQRGFPRPLGINPDIGAVEGRVLIVTTALDEFDPVGVIGAGYSLREAVRDAESGATILFDRAIFNGSTATTNTLTLTQGPLASRTNVTLDGTQNPGGIKIVTNITLVTQPIPAAIASGASVRFVAAANAVSGGVFYQWRQDGVDISGAIGPIYSISSATSGDRGVYDVVVTEGSSTGDIFLTNVTMEPGMTISQPASLTIGTPQLSIVRQPRGAMIALGSSYTLSVVAIGPNTSALTYQWLLNGKAVGGATRPNLTFVSTTLANAGAYTCVVKAGAISVTSIAAEVGVVDNRPLTVNMLAGGTFTPRINAAGNNLTYVWRLGNSALSTTANTFVIRPLTLADAGLYTCEVTGPSGSIVNGFNTTLNVNSRAPTLGAISLPTAFIGQSYYYQLPVLPIAGAAATGFSVSGVLPAGINLNTTTGVLSGRPTTTTIGGYLLAFKAIAGKLSSAEVKRTLLVNAIDPNAIGTFAGPAPRSALNGNLGGRFDLTTNPTGTFSGSVTLGARAKISFANMLLQVGGAGDQVLTGNITGIAMADTAKTPLAALVEVYVADQTARLTLTHPNGTQLVIPAWRNPWTKTLTASAYATNYTLRLDAGQGGETSPDGYGFASFSIGADGIVKLSGKLPDGNIITAGGFVGSRGQVLVFQTLYKNAGSLVGQFDITRAVPVTTNLLTGLLSWSKPRVTTDLIYKDGFAPLSVKVEGSAYVRPAAGQRLLGLPATSDNALLDFRLGALSEGWSQPITIVNPSPTGLTNTASVPPTAANGLKVAKLDAATGTFSGSFTLAGTTALLNRPATYEGMIVKVGTVTQGYGFFHLPKVPVGTEKVTTAPRLSGVVELRAP